MTLDRIEREIEARGIAFLRIEQPDLFGLPRSKTVPARRLATLARNGLNFPLPPLALDIQCEAVQGTGYLEERGYPDTTLRLDLSTFAPLHWAPDTARIIADPYHTNGAPALAGSRHLARPLLAELESLGLSLLSGFEYEFYLLDRATKAARQSGVNQFSSFEPADRAIVYDILRGLEGLGIAVTTANIEYGPGQIEINTDPAFGLAAADQAYGFKLAVKETAAEAGRLATFMTKPRIDQSASGCHFNQSLWKDGKNAFADASAPDGLSQLARHWLAGQIHHAAALTAFAAPSVNCAKRYRPHSFAPFQANWAIDNRDVAFRIKGAGTSGAHLESRIGGAAANPHILLAAHLAAGLDGIRRKLEPPAPSLPLADSDAAHLPTSLTAALAALESDAILRTALGEEFIQVFLAVKRHELAKAARADADFGTPAYHDRVSDWERAEYLDYQ